MECFSVFDEGVLILVPPFIFYFVCVTEKRRSESRGCPP